MYMSDASFPYQMLQLDPSQTTLLICSWHGRLIHH